MVFPKLSVFIFFVSLVTISLGHPQSRSSFNKRFDAKFNHVLLISIDGLHQKDVDVFTKDNPGCTLATILKNAVYFTNVQDSFPTDSFPGLMAQVTGGKPATTGVCMMILGIVLFIPPDPIVLARLSLDTDVTKLNTTLNETAFPEQLKDGKCVKVHPYDYLRVNTIFEVAKQHGLTTAWVDKEPAYTIVNGPSGKGVDDFWGPEISSINSTDVTQVKQYDGNHTQAILNWINGIRTDGTPFKVPNIFGGNFQTVSVAQKSPAGGYKNANANPTDVLEGAFKYHGQSPIDPKLLQRIDPDFLSNQVGSDKINHLTTDDVALLWLKDHSDSKAAAESLMNNKTLAITEVFEGDSLQSEFGRDPDIAIKVNPGVIYSLSTAKIAEHGGFNEDYHVPIIVYNPCIDGKVNTDNVETRSIAPFILSVLGLDGNELEAVAKEETPTLPVF
ncbi:18968_t:CDS:2 [Dentiscutata erythropus]|uniref:18968_t:CDS:1 n=1 Tax=Dentiscutata erythropus TaxID=1348616 RepID=A0A9N9CAD3_9GLOM|nr:18968_t:CDS:2 [Dentiscutata erythropus]